MTLRQARALAGWELRSAARSRWTPVASLVMGGAALAVTLLGLRSLRDLGLTGVGPASAGLLNLVVLLPPLFALLLGANGLAGARDRGMLGLLAAQPVSRLALAVAPFLGLAGALWLALLFAFGLTAVVLAGVVTGGDALALVALVGAAFAAATASLAIGVAAAALARDRVQAAGAAVGLWFLFAIGMDLAVAGLAPAVRLGSGGLLVAVLANPLEAGRVLALLGAGSHGSALGPFGAYLVDRFGSAGSVLLLTGSLAGWVVASMGVTWASLRGRDL